GGGAGGLMRWGGDAGKRLEVVDEGRLIVVATGEGQVGPVDGTAQLNFPQDTLEALHTAEQLWRQADLPFKEVDEAARAEPGALIYSADGAPAGYPVEFRQREGYRRMPVEGSARCFEQRLLQDTQLSFGRRCRQQALAQLADALAAPELGQIRMLVVQLTAWQFEERMGAAGPKMNAHDSILRRRVDDKEFGMSSADDGSGESERAPDALAAPSEYSVLSKVENDFDGACGEEAFARMRGAKALVEP